MTPSEFAERIRRAAEHSILDLTHPRRAVEVPDPERRASLVRSRFDDLAALVEAHMAYRDEQIELLRGIARKDLAS